MRRFLARGDDLSHVRRNAPSAQGQRRGNRPDERLGTRGAVTAGMATKNGKQVTTTVGDLIAAVFDVVGDQVDQVVDLLRFDEMKRRSLVEVEGPVQPSKDTN
jgi:hypothetical protein